MRRLFALAIALAACGSEPDTRPETADYIIEAILVPYCGRAACHSTNAASRGLIFDTIPLAKASLNGGIGRAGPLVIPGDSQSSELITILSSSKRIMPPDMPLPDADVSLMERWIDAGAPGLK